MRLFRTLLAMVLTLSVVTSVAAQTTVTQSTLSAALAAPSGSSPAQLASLTSATGVLAGSELFVDGEALLVTSITGTVANVQRGVDGTKAGAHASGAVFYAGPTAGVTGSPFVFSDPPTGACTLASEQYSLRVNVTNGQIWQCTNSIWLNVVDSFQFVGPGNCVYSTTGGTLATPAAVTNVGVYEVKTNGLINAGATAPGTPVMQIGTTSAGTATNTISCAVPLPSRTNASKGVYVVDATYLYGVQQTGLGTQVAVLASGTMNGVNVFGQIVFPAVGTAETPSTVAQARWDTGTLVIAPVVASSNVATTTVGGFYSIKFTPANPIAMATDMVGYYVNLTLLCTATSATSINTPGMLIHYRTVTGY